VRRFLRENSLTVVFGTLFLLTLIGQSVAGWHVVNNEQAVRHGDEVSWVGYVTSADFGVDVAENWQSEYLQFFLYVFATVWLVQRGSTDSKPPGQAGTESDEKQKIGRHAGADSPRWARLGGWRTAVYARSLGGLMGLLFLLSWLAQSIAGRAAYNSDQLADRSDPVSWFGYVSSADFWNRTLQNWQSELLAVASMAVFSIYLRQRGSSQSKPVGAPHTATGVDG
jgi:hypothetical protein